MTQVIRGLHHNAYRCRDSEQTRAFYEDFLGLPLAGTLRIGQTRSGRRTDTLHTFYELGDGSYLAFFEAPDLPFEFKAQHDFDLHIALRVDADTLSAMFEKGRASGVETRGIVKTTWAPRLSVQGTISSASDWATRRVRTSATFRSNVSSTSATVPSAGGRPVAAARS